jgi:type IV pilus assembly protein PilP
MIRNLLKNSLKHTALFAIIVALVSVTGCKKKEQAPVVQPSAPATVKKAVQKSASSATKPPQQAAVDQFDFSTKKDPFKPYAAMKVDTKLSAEERKIATRNLLPIHSFEVSQFTLIGIVTDVKENRAMVLDPNKKGYVLKRGMHIGKNNGQVKAITLNGVDVEEPIKDENGKISKKITSIALPPRK